MQEEDSRSADKAARSRRRFSSAFLVVSLAAVIVGIYWRVLSYPFIQDDWGVLKALVNNAAGPYLSDAVSMRGKLFYRPLGLIYFLVYYRLFGVDPLPFHVIGLFIHLLNSVMVSFISWRLTRNGWISWISGLLYAAAITVHLNPLLWLVGFYDLSAAFFYLASIAAFLSGRRWLSAAAFGFGLLAKESTVVLPVVLLMILLYAVRPSINLSKLIRRTLWPHGLLLVLYFLARIGLAVSPLSLQGTEPYRMKLFGMHIFKNTFRYAWWGLEALTPWRELSGSTARWILWAVFFLIVSLLFLARRSGKTGLFRRGWAVFLTGWAVCALLPVLLLPNHYYKYYLIYSMPPLILLLLSGFYWIAASALPRTGSFNPLVASPDPSLLSSSSDSPSMGTSKSTFGVRFVFTILLAVNTITAARYFEVTDRAGISERYSAGTNQLIHRGHAARIILNYLARHHPTVPAGSAFIIEGCDLESLGGADALRVFYRDDKIRVFGPSDIVSNTAGCLSVREAHLDAAKLFCLRITNGTVQEVDTRDAVTCR